MTNRLRDLEAFGQAIWLDFVDRGFLKEGGLKKLIEEDGVTGVTSNPSIFEKAMGHGEAYDEGFKEVLGKGDVSVQDLYESQAIADIKAAAADLRPVYDRLEGKDGYVSLEVSPYLANGTDDTVEEARRLWKAVGEPNLMVKVPGTESGAPAIRRLIEDGLNINVTLLFSQQSYQAVAEAFLAGLEARVEKGEPIDRIASVASFFVSRIDSEIDKAIDERIKDGAFESDALKAVRGKVAIANAKLAYAWYEEMIAGDRWKALAARGAMPQRLLWASTGVKDPAYPDTLYVAALIGKDTVNTVPPKTLDAFRDHGASAATLTEGLDDAKHVLAEAERLGLDLDRVTRGLVPNGVKQFSDAADDLLGAVAKKRLAFLGERLNGMTATLPDTLAKAVEARLETARAEGWPRRLWKGDASLWTGRDEGKWLGWLAAGRGEQVDFSQLDTIRAEAKRYRDVVLLGMGGSSLGPEVIGLILGKEGDGPTLHVLDSTDPGQISTVTGRIDPKDTLFIVSSKSGSTMEPELLRAYFWELSGRDGSRFIAVTDPGSNLEKAAKADGFAHIVPGDPAIGGRYSVLSAFGMVPAAIIGLDVEAFFKATAPMVFSCGPDSPPSVNPGMHLGAIVGEAAVAGRDKLTILPSKSLVPFGAWLEQLLAESTGKEGHGVVPVDLEMIGGPEVYGEDRLFVHLHMQGDEDAGLEARLKALTEAGQPLVSITVANPDLIGQEFFRWEIATAVAGAVIGIDPFDQPDVEDAKVATKKLVEAYESKGALDPETPILETADFAFFAPGKTGPFNGSAQDLLRAHFDALKPGGYAAFLAYIERNDADEAAISDIRTPVRDARKTATVAGFGPRFLHSTGQVYKGGPAGGVFLVVTRDPRPDIEIPGHKAEFGQVQIAQARGDTEVLAERGRVALHVHLKAEGGGIDALKAAVALAVPSLRIPMKLAVIGLGRMGAGISRRLMKGGHEVVAFDRDEKAVSALAADGATGAASLEEAVQKLEAPRIFWVMLPSGEPTESTIAELAKLASPGDVIIDGGNTFYKDDIRRAASDAFKGLHYVDVGTSGGVWGLERGFCMMIGGEKDVVDRLDPIFDTLAPGFGDIVRTKGRTTADDRAERGYIHAGPAGAGHFVKMVHNGIEYGLMQAYAEGFDILKGKVSDKLPEAERFDINLTDVAEVWRRGSVISSWLLDLSASALAQDGQLTKYSGKVADSGEGHWTIDAAMEEAVPANVLTAALFARYRSRVDTTFGDKMLSAMRFGFGGHVEMPQ